MNVGYRNIGLTFLDDYWMLRVWAPGAARVELKLEASAELLDLKPKDHGYWELEVSTLVAGDKYWIVIDGKVLPDPASLSQPDGVHGPSQATDLSGSHTENHWQNIPLRKYIIYELHTGTFSDSGDFKGIAGKLDHLISLGITAIELMPVAAFAGNKNWGYDGVFPFAVHTAYGGALELKELIGLCHRKGLAVILDVVYNHLGPEGNYLPEFGPYFTSKYQTPWGNAVNFDDRAAHGVRTYFLENAMMWFRDFGVDALRLDAVHAIKDFSATHFLQELSACTELLSKQIGRPFYLIAECDLNDPRYISSVEENGLGMHSQWVDEFHHALRVTAGEPKSGYYSDFSGIMHLAKSFKDAYVYTGMYSAERDNFFGRSAAGHPSTQFVVFSQNHDQVGNRMLGERSSVLYSFEMQKLMAATVLSSPFLPMLFMGEEWGETNPFLYFIDHTDPELVELVRKGRKEEFAAYHSSGEAPDPKAEDTFLCSKLNWRHHAVQQQAMLEYYKQLIAMRKQHQAFHSTDRAEYRLEVFEAQNCLMLLRETAEPNQLLLSLMNFSGTFQELPLPVGIAVSELLIDSSDPRWLGPWATSVPKSEQNQRQSASLHVNPESFTAYSAYYV